MKIKRIGEHDLPLPSRATAGSAGFDLRAKVYEPVIIRPLSRMLIPTGFALEIPPGWCGMVCPRSGMALRQGITVLNAPGIIDADYRGEIGVILANTDPFESLVVNHGDRIAQLVLVPGATVAVLEEVTDLDDTARGAGGFGSSGVS